MKDLDLGDEYPVMALVSVVHVYFCRFMFFIALISTLLIALASVANLGISLFTNSFGIPKLIYTLFGLIGALINYLLINLFWAVTLMYQDFFKVLIKIKDGVEGEEKEEE